MITPGIEVEAIERVDLDTKTVRTFGRGIYLGDMRMPHRPWAVGVDDVPDSMLAFHERLIADRDTVMCHESLATSNETLMRERGASEDEIAAWRRSADERIATERSTPLRSRAARAAVASIRRLATNPCIELHSPHPAGRRHAWGVQCWWAPVAAVETRWPVTEYTRLEVAVPTLVGSDTNAPLELDGSPYISNHSAYLPADLDEDCCGECNALTGTHVLWPCPVERARMAARLPEARS